MSTTIQIKRSSTASAVPLTGDLAVGELAVNLADKRLFAKQADGTIIELSTNPTDLDAATLRIDGVEITASATELNSLDGFTGSTAELNLLDGLTATTIELNTLDGITASTAELNKLDGYTGSTTELNILDGVTATTAELNFVDGVTSNIQTQLNNKQPLNPQLTYLSILFPTDGNFIVGDGTNFVTESGNTAIASLGVTATAAELNTLDGITASTTELNYTDGVTSNIQTQLNGKATTAQGALADSAVQPNDNVSFGTGSFTGAVTADGFQLGAGDKLYFNADRYFTPENNVDGAEVSANGNFTVKTGGTPSKSLVVGATGDVSFYEDTGTTAKMVWDASAERLGIGTASPASKLDIVGLNKDAIKIRSDVAPENYYQIGRNQSTGLLEFFGSEATYNGYLFKGNASDLMVINSAGNVGIGTGSPATKLHVYGASPVGLIQATSGNSILQLQSASGGDSSILRFGDNIDGDVGNITYTHSNNAMAFTTGATERARIDSSGNLLVGKSGTAFSSNGVELRPNGALWATVTGQGAASFNIKGTDGVIADFYKDGSTVGSIGIQPSGFYIDGEANHSGLRFGSYQIQPRLNGTASDGGTDLGSSFQRFKDLYLSGGVYLGGTGSANKLDDYEEGTWTPAAGAGNISGTSISYYGKYTKIGRLVVLHFRAYSPSSDLKVITYQLFSGLPFAVDSMTGTGTVITEDIDQFDRQGFAAVTGTSFAISKSGSTSGTTALEATISYYTA